MVRVEDCSQTYIDTYTHTHIHTYIHTCEEDSSHKAHRLIPYGPSTHETHGARASSGGREDRKERLIETY